jgi:HlyD family secretion protein
LKREEKRMFRRLRFLVVFLLVVGALAVVLYLYSVTNGQVLVKTGKAERGDMLITVSATATGIIESERRATLSGQTMGRLRRLLVEEGDSVSRGQLIAQLDSEEAQAQFKLAEANFQRARARLQQAEAEVLGEDHEISPDISGTQANPTQADTGLLRFGDPLENSHQLQGALDAKREEYPSTKAPKSPLPQLDGMIAKTHEVEAAKAAMQQMEALRDLARLRLDCTDIRSPWDGIVSERLAEEGEVLVAGRPILRLVDPKRLYVRVTLDEYDTQRIRKGQSALITIDAFPEETVQGKVYRISPVVSGGKMEARTFTVKVSLERNPPLKVGMSADVEIVVSELRGVLFVPSLAVVEKEARHFALVVEASRVRWRPIQIGESNRDHIQVKSGLAPGTQVVLNPDLRKLKDGQRVRIEASSMKDDVRT